MKSSAEIEREVEATRGQIDQTVEALKDKMQPKELFDEATRMMGTTSNKVLTTVVEQAKENPIPIALIGAGIAWLALSHGRRNSGSGYGYGATSPYSTYEGYDEGEGLGDKLKAQARGAVESAKVKLAGAKATAADRLHQAKDGLDSARTSAMHGAEDVRDKVAAFAGTAQERADHLRRQAQAKYEQTLQTEPLILAALGVAVGAAIGASLPASRVENRYIGPTRDKLVGKGRSFAETSLEEAKDVASRAYGQVKEELHRQTGVEGEGATLTEKAQAIADAGVKTVREEVDSRLAH